MINNYIVICSADISIHILKGLLLINLYGNPQSFILLCACLYGVVIGCVKVFASWIGSWIHAH